jgi:hypothetical protein
MELDTLLRSIRGLRDQYQVRFRLNALGQLGTADLGFRDPLAFAVDPFGAEAEPGLAELAERLSLSEQTVSEILLVSDSPWDCALRSLLLEACGLCFPHQRAAGSRAACPGGRWP